MISVSQNWKDIQSATLRPEGYVEISSGNILITKSHFQKFQYTQIGKIDNGSIPSNEFYLELLKVDGNIFDLPTDITYLLKFGFDINGTKEMVNVGYFRIKTKEIPANGLIAKYTFSADYTKNSIGDPYFIDKIYRGGSRYASASIDADKNVTQYRWTIQELFLRLGGYPFSLPEWIRLLTPNDALPACSYGEALQQLATASAYTLNCDKKTRDLGWRYELLNVFSQESTDYIISSKIQFQKPETKHEYKIKNYKVVIQHRQPDLTEPKYTINVDVPPYSDTIIDISPVEQYADAFNDETSGTQRCFLVENHAHCRNFTSIGINIFQRFYSYGDEYQETYEYAIAQEGEEVEVRFPLLLASSELESFLRQVGSMRDVITVPCRVDPRVELFDYISLELPDGNIAKGFVEYVKIDFNGAFNGEISIRVADIGIVDRLETPTISISGKTLTISPVPNATNYNIYDRNILIATISTTSYSLASIGGGEHILSVKATASGYLDSFMSNFETYTEKLNAPTITISTNILNISNVSNATSYEIYANDNFVATTDVRTYDLNTLNLATGSYSIKVKAIAEGFISSNFSSAKTFYSQLETPAISINGSIITISNVPYADSYDVYANGTYVANTSSLTYDVSSVCPAGNNYDIEVKAKSSIYQTSDFSNTETYIAPLLTPTNLSASDSVITATVDDRTTIIEVFVDGVSIGEIDLTGGN